MSLSLRLFRPGVVRSLRGAKRAVMAPRLRIARMMRQNLCTVAQQQQQPQQTKEVPQELITKLPAKLRVMYETYQAVMAEATPKPGASAGSGNKAVLDLINQLYENNFQSETTNLFLHIRHKWKVIPTAREAFVALVSSRTDYKLEYQVCRVVTRDILEFRLIPDLKLFDRLINRLIRHKLYDASKSLWDLYQAKYKDSMTLFPGTIAYLFSAAGSLRDVEFAKALVTALRAQQKVISPALWSRYLRILERESEWAEIMTEWQLMQVAMKTHGVKFEERALTNVMLAARAVRDLVTAEEVLKINRETFGKLSWYTYNAMIAVYCAAKNPNQAEAVLAEMSAEGLPLGSTPYTSLFNMYVSVGNIPKAREIWTRMLGDATVELSPVTLGVALKFFSVSGDLSRAEDIFDRLYVKHWDQCDSQTVTIMSNYLNIHFKKSQDAATSNFGERIRDFLRKIAARLQTMIDSTPVPPHGAQQVELIPALMLSLLTQIYNVGPCEEWVLALNTAMKHRNMKLSKDGLTQLFFIMENLGIVKEHEKTSFLSSLPNLKGIVEEAASKSHDLLPQRTCRAARQFWADTIAPRLAGLVVDDALRTLQSVRSSFVDTVTPVAEQVQQLQSELKSPNQK